MNLVFKGMDQVGKWTAGISKTIDFATIVALTRTANIIKDEQVKSFSARLDRPTPFTLRSVEVIPARKKNPVAIVRTRIGYGSVPSGRYLWPQVYGSLRDRKSHEKRLGMFTAPSKYEQLDAFGNIKGGRYKKILSQLGVAGGAGYDSNATKSRRSKARRKQEAFFVRGNVIFSRKDGGPYPHGEKGQTLRPVLILYKQRPKYRQRVPWNATSRDVFASHFEVQYRKALAEVFANK